MRNFKFKAEKFKLHTPFVISRGARVDTTVIVVEIFENGYKGWGESCPTPHYNESVESVMGQIKKISPKIKAGLSRNDLQTIMPAGAARNAIDCALWDLEAKHTGKNIAELMGHHWPDNLQSVETISIGSADKMGKKAATLAKFSNIKVKMNAEDIEARIMAVHKNAPNARLIIDANESWNLDIIERVAEMIKDNGVVMLEQPLPPKDDELLRGINAPLPLGADESCHVAADLSHLEGIYDVVNIKLDKTGGLTEAKKLLDQAKKLDFDIMVGCMVGTSLSMAAGMFIATEASFVDLDAPTMLSTDRKYPLSIVDGKMSPLNPNLFGGTS